MPPTTPQPTLELLRLWRSLSTRLLRAMQQVWRVQGGEVVADSAHALVPVPA